MLVRLNVVRTPQDALDRLSAAVGREIALDEWGITEEEFETDADRHVVLAAALDAGVSCLVIGEGKGSLVMAGRLYEAEMDGQGNVSPVPDDAPLRDVVAARRLVGALEERRLSVVPEGEGDDAGRKRAIAKMKVCKDSRDALIAVCRVMETLDVEGVVDAAVAAGCLTRREAVMELEAWVEEAVTDTPPGDVARDAFFHVMSVAILAGGDAGEPMDFDEAARRIMGFPRDLPFLFHLVIIVLSEDGRKECWTEWKDWWVRC